MFKKILIITVLSIMVFQGAAFAAGEGETVFRDSLYGAAIGALLGVAVYAIDADHFGTKVGAGVLIGTFGGLFYGLKETSSLAEIENGKIKLAVPTPVIQKTNSGTLYSASLLNAKF
ncbi:MAG: glycine zipper family protein [Nitrospirae bacterium]|nr:glycine zipper family protein [Nitrospirota bacterium]